MTSAERAKRWRKKNPGWAYLYSRIWDKQNKEKIHIREKRRWQREKFNPLKYHQPDPVKYKARMILNNAISRGLVTKHPCSICGNSKTQAHHQDYAKPLIMIWLCSNHHVEVHKRAA